MAATDARAQNVGGVVPGAELTPMEEEILSFERQ